MVEATPAQRQEFIDTFYDFLLRSYSRYVLRFEKDKVRILAGYVYSLSQKK